MHVWRWFSAMKIVGLRRWLVVNTPLGNFCDARSGDTALPEHVFGHDVSYILLISGIFPRQQTHSCLGSEPLSWLSKWLQRSTYFLEHFNVSFYRFLLKINIFFQLRFRSNRQAFQECFGLFQSLQLWWFISPDGLWSIASSSWLFSLIFIPLLLLQTLVIFNYRASQ